MQLQDKHLERKADEVKDFKHNFKPCKKQN